MKAAAKQLHSKYHQCHEKNPTVSEYWRNDSTVAMDVRFYRSLMADSQKPTVHFFLLTNVERYIKLSMLLFMLMLQRYRFNRSIFERKLMFIQVVKIIGDPR